MALAWLLLCLVLPGHWPEYEAPADEDDVALREEVEYLLVHPIDLNRATVEDLLAVPWLNPLLAYRIVATRDSLGGFAFAGRLKDVPGMTEEQYELLLPIVAVLRKAAPGWTGGLMGRVVADTLPPKAGSLSSFGRFDVRQGPWRGSAVVEKDRGERSWADWLGIGLQYAGPELGVTSGDYSIGSGLGLVFSGPYRRSSTGWLAGSSGPSAMKLAGSALENRNLRGLGAELALGPWQLAGFGSAAGRDARLNPDGTVEKLVLSGTHDDSASLASRNRVQEAAAGILLARRWRNLRLRAGGCGVRYNRAFAPHDSADSFYGSSLAAGGVGIEANTGAYLVGAEAAVSSGGGYAGAFELNGDWQGLNVALAATGRAACFFAPLGRWRTLADRRSRLDCRARIGFRRAGFRFGLSGNTYRDFAIDSLPARVEFEAGYDAGRLAFGLRLGRSSRLEQERSRTARLDLGGEFRQGGLMLIVADEYPELTEGRGRMAGLVARLEPDRFWLVATAARFDIAGSGVRMYFSEYGPMRTGLGFSTATSAWRAAFGLGFRLRRGAGFGLRLGYTFKDASVFELGAQAEMGLSGKNPQ